MMSSIFFAVFAAFVPDSSRSLIRQRLHWYKWCVPIGHKIIDTPDQQCDNHNPKPNRYVTIAF